MNAFEAQAAKIEATSPYLSAFIRPDRKFLRMDWFSYNIELDGLDVGPSSGQIQFMADSDFILTQINAENCDFRNEIGILLQITDLSTGKTFYSAPTPMVQVVGTDGFPYLLPVPRLIAPKTTLQFDMTTPGVVRTPSIFLALVGYRVF